MRKIIKTILPIVLLTGALTAHALTPEDQKKVDEILATFTDPDSGEVGNKIDSETGRIVPSNAPKMSKSSTTFETQALLHELLFCSDGTLVTGYPRTTIISGTWDPEASTWEEYVQEWSDAAEENNDTLYVAWLQDVILIGAQ